ERVRKLSYGGDEAVVRGGAELGEVAHCDVRREATDLVVAVEERIVSRDATRDGSWDRVDLPKARLETRFQHAVVGPARVCHEALGRDEVVCILADLVTHLGVAHETAVHTQ